MNGIRKPAVILADSMEEYMATPDPYKPSPVGKKIDELTADEILQFKIP